MKHLLSIGKTLKCPQTLNINMKNFEIESIGYKFRFNSTEKILYYKMTMESVEYLVTKRDLFWYCAKWLASNEMKFIEFDIYELAEIARKMFRIVPSDIFLGDNDELSFFTQHAIDAPNKKTKSKRKNKTYTANEITKILDICQEFDILYDKGVYKPITQEMADFADESEYTLGVLDDLVGYEIMVYNDGFHKTDGQMVGYDFTLKSPKGKITEFSTDMCLMVGWNYCDELKIN